MSGRERLAAGLGCFVLAGVADGFLGGWGWGAFVAAGAIVAWRGEDRIPKPAKGWALAAGSLLVFAASAAVRVWRIGDLPPFFWDEGLQAYDTRCVLAHLPLEPLGIPYHRSPVWQWLSVATASAAGVSVAGLRLLPAACGAAAAALTFAAGARLAGWLPGTLAAGWMVLHPWPVNLSRLLMVPAIVPFCGALVVWLAVMLRPGMAAAVVCGAAAGLAAYTYPAALHLPLLAGVLPLALGARWGGPAARRRDAAVAFGVALAVVLPSLFWPAGFWRRAAYVSAMAQPGWVLDNAARLLAHVRSLPVAEPRDLFPALPGLVPIYLAPFFLLGAVLLVRRAVRDGEWVVPGWLGLALLPAFASHGGMEKVFRFGGALPPVALVAAAGGACLPLLLGRRAGGVALAAVWIGGLGWSLEGYFHGFFADPVIGTAYRVFDLEVADDLARMVRAGSLRLGAPMPLAKFPVERFVLFDALHDGRIAEGGKPCAEVHPARVYRNALKWPAAILLAGDGVPACVELRTIEDIGIEGDRLLIAGRPRAALAHYRRYTRWMPDAPRLWVRRGFAARRARRPAEAAAAFGRAIALGERAPDAYDGCAAALTDLGRREEAMQTLRDGLEQCPDDPVLRDDLDRLKAMVKARR